MAATSRRVPGYLHHRPTGQARVILDGRTHYLGTYGSDESRSRYNRLLAEWLANGRTLPASRSDSHQLTIDQLIDAYLDHAEKEYRHPDGTPTREIVNVRYPLRELHELFADQAAATFGPRDLKMLRDRMISKGWCRRLVNQRISIVRRVFRWAVAEERIPASVIHGLSAVCGLRRGRCGVRESEPVTAVSEDHVLAVLPFLTPTLQSMLWIQWYTGCRPGEVCALRVEDVSRDGTIVEGVPIWTIRLKAHKTAVYGQSREIIVGPRAQEVLLPYVKDRQDGVVFSPRRSELERKVALREARKTAIGPAQRARDELRRREPKQEIADCYTTLTYGRALARAAGRAGIPAFGPNRIRHATATRLRVERGLEASGACLGHSRLETTQIYAATRRAQALTAMAELG
jgi:integrase